MIINLGTCRDEQIVQLCTEYITPERGDLKTHFHEVQSLKMQPTYWHRNDAESRETQWAGTGAGGAGGRGGTASPFSGWERGQV